MNSQERPALETGLSIVIDMKDHFHMNLSDFLIYSLEQWRLPAFWEIKC